MASFLAPLLDRPDGAYVLRNRRTGAIVANRLEQAFDSARRRRGLLGRDGLDRGAALIIAPCSSIHTFFMRFAIDVAFTARDGRLVKVVAAIPAWRLAFGFGAHAAIEMAAGELARSDTRAGDVLEIVPDGGTS